MLHFLAGCHKRRLNQALFVFSLVIVFFFIVFLLIRATFYVLLVYVRRRRTTTTTTTTTTYETWQLTHLPFIAPFCCKQLPSTFYHHQSNSDILVGQKQK